MIGISSTHFSLDFQLDFSKPQPAHAWGLMLSGSYRQFPQPRSLLDIYSLLPRSPLISTTTTFFADGCQWVPLAINSVKTSGAIWALLLVALIHCQSIVIAGRTMPMHSFGTGPEVDGFFFTHLASALRTLHSTPPEIRLRGFG